MRIINHKRIMGMMGIMLMALSFTLTASAEKVLVNGLYYELLTTNTAEVAKANDEGTYQGNIAIPQSIVYEDATYTVVGVGNAAFQNCVNIQSVTIPGTVKYIGKNAFSRCGNLKTVSLANGLETINSNAFYQCQGIESINIPNTVTFIDFQAFYWCIKLKNVKLSENLTSTEYGVFSRCSALESITIPESLTTLARSLFSNCTSLKTVKMPRSLKVIGNQCFENCTSLETITLPNQVTTIGKWAFRYCSNLKNFTVGSSHQTITMYAFEGCTALTDFFCYAINVPTTDYDIFKDSNVANATLHVPAHSVNAYREAEQWSQFKNFIPLDASFYLFVIDEASGWTDEKPLRRIGESLTYEGYCYLNGDYRIKPYEEWSDDWGYNPSTGRMEVGATTNFTAEEGFYQVTVNLSNMTCTLVKLRTISLIGDFNNWSDENEVELSYIKSLNKWSTSRTFTQPSEFKIRANHSWDICWGGTVDNLVKGRSSDNLFAVAATQRFELTLVCEGENKLTITQTSAIAKCKSPTISYNKGKIEFACETEDAEFHYTITSSDENDEGTGNSVTLGAMYIIKVYASAEGYEDSDTATATIKWNGTKPVMTGFAEVELDDTYEDTTIEGDMNKDGKLSVADIMELMKVIAAQSTGGNEGEEEGEGGEGEGGEGEGGEGTTEPNNVQAFYGGGTIRVVDGVIQEGSQLTWRFKNGGTDAVTLVAMKLVNGVTGDESENLLEEEEEVAAGETKLYTVIVDAQGTQKPKIKFTYRYKGQEFDVEASSNLNKK